MKEIMLDTKEMAGLIDCDPNVLREIMDRYKKEHSDMIHKVTDKEYDILDFNHFHDWLMKAPVN